MSLTCVLVTLAYIVIQICSTQLLTYLVVWLYSFSSSIW